MLTTFFPYKRHMFTVAANDLSALPACCSCFFAAELVCPAFLMGGSPALPGYLSLFFGIHGSEATAGRGFVNTGIIGCHNPGFKENRTTIIHDAALGELNFPVVIANGTALCNSEI
jgi:hypothetical protein